MAQNLIASEEAEKAILGAVLLEPSLIVRLEVEPSDFYSERNALIYKEMLKLSEDGKGIDYVTLSDSLGKRLPSVGGVAYLTELVAATVSTANAEEYAGIVRDKAKRRRLVSLASEIAKAAFDESNPVEVALPKIVDGIIDAAAVRGGAEHIGNVLSRLYDEVAERYKSPSEVWGIGSGFKTFDRITGGMHPGELMILSGVPGVGKSIFAMQMAAQMGASSPGVIYSLEMSSLQVARRLVSGKSGIATRSMKSGKISQEEWATLAEAISAFEKLPVYISDFSGWTTIGLRADMARLKAKYNIQWFVLDYLFLLQDGYGYSEIERTNLASRGLKCAARELDVAGVVVHSMTKAAMEAQTPEQFGLRGSGQVIYDADIVCFLTNYTDKTHEMFRLNVGEKKDNVRLLWFKKGREIEDTRGVIAYYKQDKYPAFYEMKLN